MSRPIVIAARAAAIWAIPLTAVSLWAQLVASPADKRVVVNFLVTLILVLGLQIFTGNSGIVSFGSVGLMGVGAYVGALLTIPVALKESIVPDLPTLLLGASVPYIPAMLIAAVMGGLVAAVLGIGLARMKEPAMAMATFSVLIIMFVVFENWEAVTRGPTGLYGIPQATTVWKAAAIAVGVVFLARWYKESDAGLELRASRTDSVAAEALGVDVVRRRWQAWVLSGSVMAIGGFAWASFNVAFGPRQFFFITTFALLAMLIVGGQASVSGAVAGVSLLTVLSEVLRRLESDVGMPGLTQMIVAGAMLVVLYVRPNGLAGFAEIDGFFLRRFGSNRQ